MEQPDDFSTRMQVRYGERYRWWLLIAVMLGTVASIISSTVVNVAIPDMSHHFGLGQERAQWVASGFMVASTMAMLTTPWLLARYGYLATYTAAMAALMAGGLLGGVATNFDVVMLARVLEGLSAGVVQPIPAIIIMSVFQPHEQGRASGIFGMGVVLAPALGPSLGGILVDAFGWRSVFYMVVPMCLIAIAMARRVVPPFAPGRLVPQKGQGPALDVFGLTLGTAATLLLLNGLIAVHSGPAWLAVAYLTTALVAIASFIAWQRRLQHLGKAPLMDLRLFRSRSFSMGCIVSFIYGTALYGSTYLLPVFMQLGLNISPTLVGALMLPASFVLAITIAGVGRMADHQPTWVLVVIGMVLLALSFALMWWVGLSTPFWLLVGLTIIGRIGLGFILPSLNLGSMRPLPKAMMSQGSSVIGFVRMLGGAIGVSLCGIVLEWRLTAHGVSLSSGVSNGERTAAFGETFVMLAVLCVVATAAAWRLRENAPPATPPGA